MSRGQTGKLSLDAAATAAAATTTSTMNTTSEMTRPSYKCITAPLKPSEGLGKGLSNCFQSGRVKLRKKKVKAERME